MKNFLENLHTKINEKINFLERGKLVREHNESLTGVSQRLSHFIEWQTK